MAHGELLRHRAGMRNAGFLMRAAGLPARGLTPNAVVFGGGTRPCTAPRATSSSTAGAEVLVLGTGVIGMTTALRLLQEAPGVRVTVVGHQLGGETTTAGAAGLWGPYKLWDTPAELVERWSSETLAHLYDLVHSPQAEASGVSVRLVHSYAHDASEIPEPAWAKGVDNWAPLSARQLARVARTRKLGQPLRAGWSYHSVACEGGPYLSWLHQRVQRAGGRVLRAPRPVGALGALLDRQEHATWRHAPPDPPPAPFVPPQPSSQSGAPGGGIQGLTLEQFLQRDGAHAPLPPTPVPGTSPPASLEGLAPFEGLGGRAPALVVNCSGLGAGRLLNDKEVAPIRGQMVRVWAPWVTSAYLTPYDLYVIPNNYTIVLGGTGQMGDWNLEADMQDRRRIVREALDLLPSLATGVIVGDWVGLRPGRSSVRLELGDSLTAPGAGPAVPVIHNYGHGGSGLTLAWGCAGDAVRLAKQALGI